MSAAKNARRKEKSSPDYPLLAGRFAEASRDEAPSKLPPGLYIVATPIGNLGDISLRALWTLMHVDRIACEDTRLSGALLAHYGIKKPLLPYHDHNADKVRPQILQKLSSGRKHRPDQRCRHAADRRSRFQTGARLPRSRVSVSPLFRAPTRRLTALAGSGLPTDQFLFCRFPAAETGGASRKRLRSLRRFSRRWCCYEAPQRLADALDDLAKLALGATRPAAVARELTKMFEETIACHAWRACGALS